MDRYQQTRLWRESLSPREGDPHSEGRERLRAAYNGFRERARHLSGEIHRSLPDFTVHGIDHIDALWEIADVLAGGDLHLNPLETFVLGGAFLVHDLGLGLAAYPGGEDEIAREPLWRSEVARLLRRETSRATGPVDPADAPAEVKLRATATVLRELHARQAERVVTQSWSDASGEHWYLLHDPELRTALGGVIGRIAASHWWNTSRLRGDFGVRVGAPAAFPREWDVDPLLLAALIRVADAAQLDARRAPGFLFALRNPGEEARPHWVFQQHLNQPRLEQDQLVFTSGRAFPIRDADAWWLCLDHLRQLDRELGDVDRLLADSGRPRLAARAVRSVSDPEGFAALVRTEGWLPVDARVRVGDAVGLVRRLGGEQLYGDDPSVALRELVQNASDAVRARRLIERRTGDWGDIRVRTGSSGGTEWIEVEDNGVGMSQSVVTGPLLEFGESYWGSALMLRELPGLLGAGFEPTGQFGIGFFSVFMVATRVTVVTRRYDAAQADTFILEFGHGLGSRPVLRRAIEGERLIDGGTRVRLWLDRPVKHFAAPMIAFWDLFHLQKIGFEMLVGEEPELPVRQEEILERLCGWLFPTLDANIFLQEDNDTERHVIVAGDWLVLPPSQLVLRLFGLSTPGSEEMAEALAAAERAMSPIVEDGLTVGRAYIEQESRSIGSGTLDFCVITTGGIRVDLMRGAVGVMNGTAETASRSNARVAVDRSCLIAWAEEQGRIAQRTIRNPVDLADIAGTIAEFGGNPRTLPIAEFRGAWVSGADIRAWRNPVDEYLLVEASLFDGVNVEGVPVDLPEYPELFVLKATPRDYAVVRPSRHLLAGPPLASLPRRRSRFHLVVEALADLWAVTPDAVLACSDDNGRLRTITTRAGEPVKAYAWVLRNPCVASARNQAATS